MAYKRRLSPRLQTMRMSVEVKALRHNTADAKTLFLKEYKPFVLEPAVELREKTWTSTFGKKELEVIKAAQN